MKRIIFGVVTLTLFCAGVTILQSQIPGVSFISAFCVDVLGLVWFLSVFSCFIRTIDGQWPWQ